MTSWNSEKSAAGTENGYLPVPNRVDDSGLPQAISLPQLQEKQRAGRSRCSYVAMFILGVCALLLALGAGPYIERQLWGGRRNARGIDDIFENWGRAGTGTEGLAWYPTDFLRDVVPIKCHSHNDYWRKVPFFSAVHAGCIGVEADVWLRGGDLLVGHDTAALQPNRTFQNLYVKPIVELLERNNPTTEFYSENRRGIFDVDPEQSLILLIDLKTGGAETWPWVMRQLEPLREKGWLSFFQDGKVHKRLVTVVGTGNTPFSLIVANSTYRDAFFDAPLDQLENSAYDSTNSYYASASFWKSIGNVWLRGEPNQDQLLLIRAQIREAHKRGLKSRYWELPPWPIHTRNRIWQILVEEGMDLLNVDDLEAAARGDWTKPGFFFR